MINHTNSNANILEIAKVVNSEGSRLIDVRSPEKYAAGHAEGAENIPDDILEGKIDELKKLEAVYLICTTGGRSSRVTEHLRAQGVNAIDVPGGTNAWREAGLPM